MDRRVVRAVRAERLGVGGPTAGGGERELAARSRRARASRGSRSALRGSRAPRACTSSSGAPSARRSSACERVSSSTRSPRETTVASSSRSCRVSPEGPNMIALYSSIERCSTSGLEAHRLDDVEDLPGALDRGVVLLLRASPSASSGSIRRRCGTRDPTGGAAGSLSRGAAWARWPSRSSKPVRCGSPTLGRFDSGAAPSSRFAASRRRRAARVPGSGSVGGMPAEVPRAACKLADCGVNVAAMMAACAANGPDACRRSLCAWRFPRGHLRTSRRTPA